MGSEAGEKIQYFICEVKMKKLSVICIILTIFWVSCEDILEPEEELDTTPPSVLITNPADGATVLITKPTDGSTLTETIIIKVSATDDDSVTKVSFFVDGDSIGVGTVLPFEHEWKVTFWADSGAHSLFAKVTDKSDNVGISDIVSVTISNLNISSLNINDFEIRELIQSERPWNVYSSAINLEDEIITDSDSVLMWEYGDKRYYHPVYLASASLHNIYSYNLTQNSEYLIRAERYMHKLIEESFRINSSIYFSYNFDLNLHGTYQDNLLTPWYSGMAQGLGLAALVRLYNITSNVEYLTASAEVFSTFKRIGLYLDPWTVFIDEKGYYWIEEYPINFPEYAADHVLNGFIFGIYGLYDYYLLTKGSDEKDILLAAITTIYNYISSFRNVGDVSFYCLRHKIKPIGYHSLHQKQLSMLSKITGDPFFQSMADTLYDDYH